MKALSLKQPWAELIICGKKTIETRKWNTQFRGEFLIHASMQPDKESVNKFRFQTLPLGCIVGKATLVSVKKYYYKQDFDKDIPQHLVELPQKSWKKPRYGFLLTNVQRINPVPYKGQLNFFEVKQP